MIDPQTLDLLRLPFQDFSLVCTEKGRILLPEVPVVYFCLLETGKPVYIGETDNLCRRWIQHDKKAQCKNLEVQKLAWLETVHTDSTAWERKGQRIKIERTLIRYYSSVLNGVLKAVKSKDVSQTGLRVIIYEELEIPNLGQRIREARMSDPRSLKEICSLVGMTPQNWYRMESEKQSLSIEKLRTIEKVLNIDLGVSFDD